MVCMVWLACFSLNAWVWNYRPMKGQRSSEVSVLFLMHETSDKDLTQCNNDSLYTSSYRYNIDLVRVGYWSSIGTVFVEVLNPGL